ncbi:site-specific recombinase XerD [Nonomuraea fuscirosea]|uniref:Site-specific recombinase XerD n=1 Tax=Nonomuraea fuscirosea TaxID=1291556 RepID=A0A2T0N304_9ACTN|nr:site-specific recombinase XerD [Nonomuraea fuscirosea]
MRRVAVEGAAHLVLADGVVPLRPAETLFEGMLTGWERQQRARLLAASTIRTRVDLVRRFALFTGTSPWEWLPGDVEDWATELLSTPNGLARSTVRNYLNQIAMFCDYITDARYGWAEQCLEHFGAHPVQICHEENMPSHSAPYEGRPEVRALSRRELQDFFDYADEQVVRIRSAGRKGWAPAFRDATVFKVIYAWGLRRREAAQLDLADFSRNAKAPEFGRYGACYVRFGKATKGSPPRRRTVLTVWEWAAEALAEYVEEVRPHFAVGKRQLLWPTDSGGRLQGREITRRFATYRDALGLDEELHPHCLRHSYVTHLIEDGADPSFVQRQVGHAWGSTTAIYAHVGSDFMNNALREVLNAGLGEVT